VFNWNLGAFRARNADDIINVASPLIGRQYFQNGGNTLRRGIEAGMSFQGDRLSLFANYTYVQATFISPLTLSSPFNPYADANGLIHVVSGDRIPAVPDYRAKAGVDYKINEAWKLGADINMIGSQYLVGDQSNQNPKVPAYWVANLHTSYQATKNIEVFALVRNLFNRHYLTFGTFFETNSFPYLNLTDPRTFIPGIPFAVYAGLRASL
jgi:iron complex outermembrane receptor protein